MFFWAEGGGGRTCGGGRGGGGGGGCGELLSFQKDSLNSVLCVGGLCTCVEGGGEGATIFLGELEKVAIATMRRGGESDGDFSDERSFLSCSLSVLIVP